MTQQATHRLLKRLRAKPNMTACVLPLHPVQYTTLNAVWALMGEATLNRVIEFVYETTDDVLDVAQTYKAIDDFKDPAKFDPPLVNELGHKIPSPTGRRELACFEITQQGKTLIAKTEAQLLLLLDYGRRAQAIAQSAQAIAQPAKARKISSRKKSGAVNKAVA